MAEKEERPPARARDILKHYLENPRMADTLEGIAGWMLLDEVVQRGVEETQEALRWLVARGYLKRAANTGAAAPLYRLEREHIDEAEQFLSVEEPARGESPE